MAEEQKAKADMRFVDMAQLVGYCGVGKELGDSVTANLTRLCLWVHGRNGYLPDDGSFPLRLHEAKILFQTSERRAVALLKAMTNAGYLECVGRKGRGGGRLFRLNATTFEENGVAAGSPERLLNSLRNGRSLGTEELTERKKFSEVLTERKELEEETSYDTSEVREAGSETSYDTSEVDLTERKNFRSVRSSVDSDEHCTENPPIGVELKPQSPNSLLLGPEQTDDTNVLVASIYEGVDEDFRDANPCWQAWCSHTRGNLPRLNNIESCRAAANEENCVRFVARAVRVHGLEFMVREVRRLCDEYDPNDDSNFSETIKTFTYFRRHLQEALKNKARPAHSQAADAEPFDGRKVYGNSGQRADAWDA